MSQTIRPPRLVDGNEADPVRAASDAFARRLVADGQELVRGELSTLQLNLGKMCNLACHHCHVEAGPSRSEIMSWNTMRRIVEWVDHHRDALSIQVVDLTGGAPEMNPHFQELVREFMQRGIHVLDRCNLTILLDPDHDGLVEFMAEHDVEIVASLPCYLEENVDQQRGQGVFNNSILALRKLNAIGYGRPATGLRLDLVYNPVGYGLPPDQIELERSYKRHLLDEYGIVFDRLWTITNMPIRRFEHALRRDGTYASYMKKLVEAHGPTNLDGVMCRYLISVGWQGAVYDCDFNQMLQMSIEPDTFGPDCDEQQVERNGRKLWEYRPDELVGRRIRTGNHCFGCTAGAGSSCTGALA